MSGKICDVVLIILFTIHNIEEILEFNTNKAAKIVDKNSFLIAVVFLEVLVVTILWYYNRYNFFTLELFRVFIYTSVLFNAVIHVFISLINKRYFAGFYSALFGIIPFVAYVFAINKVNIAILTGSIWYVLGNIVFYLLSIYISLILGKVLLKLLRVTSFK